MPTIFRFWKSAFLVVGATALVCFPIVSAARPDPAVLQTVNAWQQHRDAFQQFECRFRVTEGMASSTEAALNGELDSARTSTFLWAVDGDRERCRRISSLTPEPLDSTPWGEPGLSYVIRGERCTDVLMAGGIGLNVAEPVGAASIAGPGKGSVVAGNEFSTPFSIGMTGECWSGTPRQRVQDYLKHQLPITVSESQQADGTPLVTLTLPDDRPGLLRYEFLPDQGMMLTRFRAEMPGRVYECVVTDWQETAAGMFPTRGVRIDRVDGAGIRVEIVEVEELRVGPVDSGSFQVVLPAGMWVNAVNEGTKFQLRQERAIDATDLPGLLAGR